MVIRRFDVFLVALDPTLGSGIRKTRPCLVISPDEINSTLSTIIIAPMMSRGREYVTRIACLFDGKSGQILLDQIRTVDKVRLVRRLGKIGPSARKATLAALAELFAE